MMPNTQPCVPLVSIIITTYNYGDFVLEAVESALNQSYSNIEVIVVDDGSTDETRELLIPYKEKIHYYYKAHESPAASRNAGINLARGEYLQFFDADDILDCYAVEHKVKHLERFDQQVFCYGKTLHFKDTQNKGRVFYYRWRVPALIDKHRALYIRNIASTHSFLIRAKEIQNFSVRFDTSLTTYEDYDFWFRLALIVGPPTVVPQSIVYYRQHSGSLSKRRLELYEHKTVVVQRVFRTIENNELIEGVTKDEALVLHLVFCFRIYRQLFYLDSEKASGFYMSFIKPALIESIFDHEFDKKALKTLLYYLTELRRLIILTTIIEKSIPLEDVIKLRQVLYIDFFTGSRSIFSGNFAIKDCMLLMVRDGIDLTIYFLSKYSVWARLLERIYRMDNSR